MKEENTSIRLKKIMSMQGLKQKDLLNKCAPICEKYNKIYNKKIHISKSDLSQWLSGLYEPSQNKLTVLAEALGVNEVWLMGYDVDYESTKTITINEKDFITLDNDFLELKKGTEITFEHLVLYINMVYATLLMTKHYLIIINNLIRLFNEKKDFRKLEIIPSVINDALENIDSIKDIKYDFDLEKSRKESVYILSQINEIIREYDNKVLEQNTDIIDFEQELKSIENYIKTELKNPITTGKRINFNFRDEIYSIINKTKWK